MVLYASLGACALAAALVVLRYDLHDREPPVLLLATAAWGALVMWTMGIVEPWVIDDLVGRHDALLIATVAATFEETGKLVAVAGVALAVPLHFNDPLDGLVYGAMAGLGAALEESVFLMSLFPPNGPWVPAGELVRLAGHLVMGGIGAFGVGLVRVGHPKRWLVAPLCFAVAVAIHLAWDWLALTETIGEDTRVLAAMAVMAAGLLAFGALVARGARLSRDVFAPDSPATPWGWPFSPRRPPRDAP